MAVAVGQCLSWNPLPSGNRGPSHVNVPHNAHPLRQAQGPEDAGIPFDKLRERRKRAPGNGRSGHPLRQAQGTKRTSSGDEDNKLRNGGQPQRPERFRVLFLHRRTVTDPLTDPTTVGSLLCGPAELLS